MLPACGDQPPMLPAVLQEGKPLILGVVREAERRVVEDPKQDKARMHSPACLPACLAGTRSHALVHVTRRCPSACLPA